MGSGFVRFGGVSALLIIAVFVVLIALGAASPTAMQNKAIVVVFSIVIYGLLIAVFLATKVLWNRFGRNGANIPIVFMILMMIAFFVLGLFGGGFQPGARMGNVLGYVYLALLALYFIAWFWFAIYCIPAGSGAGGVWKAAGILYLIGSLVGVIAAIIGIGFFIDLLSQMGALGGETRTPSAETAAAAGIFGVIGFIAGLVLLAGWICHAIGLLVGAGKMDQAR